MVRRVGPATPICRSNNVKYPRAFGGDHAEVRGDLP